jgi:hypothetical protein
VAGIADGIDFIGVVGHRALRVGNGIVRRYQSTDCRGTPRARRFLPKKVS